jgi:hypothetical protein
MTEERLDVAAVFVCRPNNHNYMLVTLPELAFTTYGDAVLDPNGPRSSARSTPRRYPRTDLQVLTPWTSFPTDIHQAIQAAAARSHLALGAPLDIHCWQRQGTVSSEEEIRAHATTALHAPVEDVLTKFRVTGRFTVPGGGNSTIVGHPDYSWVMGYAQPHPKVVVRRSPYDMYTYYRTPFVYLDRVHNLVGGGSGGYRRCV